MRTLPTLEIETKLWQNGYQLVCGMDEVGRGCFAGPVVVGAVIFPKDVVLPQGVADSKFLTAPKREKLDQEIKRRALFWAIAEISVLKIDKAGIGKSVQMAFRKVIKSLEVNPDFILIDAFNIKHLARNKQQAVQEGDTVCASIAAASIVAKVYRDKLMEKYHQKYPQYGFAVNKGYGTVNHRQALKQYGLCKIHRRSFNLNKFLV